MPNFRFTPEALEDLIAYIQSFREAVPGSPPGDARRLLPADSSSTGFYVTAGGHVLTTAHSVHECATVDVRQAFGERVTATVEEIDRSNDVALLKTADGERAHAVFALEDSVREGDEIVTFGFPLAGILSARGNVTTGRIAALEGIGDDPGQMQISAQIQPGSSGAPVLDRSGNVIGMVIGKLDEHVLIRRGMVPTDHVGPISQNVNFAVKGSVLKTALIGHEVRYHIGPSTREIAVPEIADIARRMAVRIECHR